MLWKPNLGKGNLKKVKVEKVIYLDYIINDYPALNFFAYILTSLK